MPEHAAPSTQEPPRASDPLATLDWNQPGAIAVPSAGTDEVKPRRRRRRWIAGSGSGLIATAIAALFAFPSLRNQLPASVPLVGKNADSVWSQIQDSGLGVEDGVPSAPKFRELVNNNSCKSSHSFVQSRGDSGWALICVKPPRAVYRNMRNAMNDIPALLLPMWVDQNHGEVIIFGMGWPGRASEQVADAIGGNAEYLTFRR